MTPIEIVALTEQGLTLIAKIIEIIQAAQKGELAPDEARKRMSEYAADFKRAIDGAYSYLDEQFDKGE